MKAGGYGRPLFLAALGVVACAVFAVVGWWALGVATLVLALVDALYEWPWERHP